MVDRFRYPPENVISGVMDLIVHETGRPPARVQMVPGQGGYIIRVEMPDLPKRVIDRLGKVLPRGYELATTCMKSWEVDR